YAAWCAKAAKPEHCIQMRQKFPADVAAAEKAGTPVSDEIQNRVFEMIEARQDELAAAFAPEQDEEHVPA
ncbi:hypothetical protein, partial [Acidomonas methanolica]|uniref:hypothetical protein n=1 Tax=Acidomonas methanolica TaxID=437 RepID=UPI002230D6F3